LATRQTWLALGIAVGLGLGVLECKAPSQTQADHGRELYGKICAVCHGPNGEGYKADAAPALAHPDFLMSVSDAHLRRAIERGRPGTTMSAWGKSRGGPLEPSDVDAVISFLRTWQKGPRAMLDERPLAGDATRGLGTWTAQCASCHGLTGTGGQYTNLSNPELLTSATDGYLRYAIRNGRLGTPMNAFQNLGENGIDDLVSLLRAWQSPAAPDAGPNGNPMLAAQPAVFPAPLALGKVLAHPNGPEPLAFKVYPGTVGVDLVKSQVDRNARFGMLDARAPSDYTNEHITGAVSVPFYDPDPYLEKLPKDAWLICYCACPHAESGQLASKLQAKGFTKVTVLEEGINVWKNKKYPVSKGPLP
jgi:cytochrome c oxidase cbb3-type subunit 3/ubiquinol-cytochrome c reductase cytochrome c subunit